jgi:hypothetical protein
MLRNAKLPNRLVGGIMKFGGGCGLHKLRKRWQIHFLVLVAYLALALLLTWPLLLHLTTHVPGNGVDDPPLTWNLWWVRYALLDLGDNPFDSDYLFYPLGINLGFYTLTLLNGLLSIPLQAAFGLVTASNIILLSSFALSGYGAFLLALYVLDARGGGQLSAGAQRRPTGRHRNLAGNATPWLVAVAFVVGTLYAFSSNKLAYAALGQWNIASSQWIPFYVLYLFKMTETHQRWRYAVMAALFLLLQAYAELTYATFLLLFTALWAVWYSLCRARARESGGVRRLTGNLVLVGILFGIGLSPVMAMVIPDMLVEGDVFAVGGGFSDVFSADLLGFLVPTMYHPYLGGLVERFGFHYSVGQHIYAGWAVLVLTVVGAVYWWRRPGVQTTSREAELVRPAPRGSDRSSRENRYSTWIRFWSLSAFLFWLMTMGPTLRINGHDTGFPLPFALVERLPFFEGNRYPSRYSVLLVLSLSMLVGFGLLALQRQMSERRPLALRFLSLFLVLFLLFEHLALPLPLSGMAVPGVYEIIAEEVPSDATLLDLPVAWRNGARVTGTQDPIIMFEQYYQSSHGKRLLAGNTSRNPPLKFQYFVEAPVINTIIALETGHEVDAAVIREDARLATGVLRFFNIQAIIAHPRQTGPDMIPYIEAIMPVQLFYEDDDIAAYWVELPAWSDEWILEPGDSLSRLSFAEGWGPPAEGAIWAQRRAARLLIPLNGEAQVMSFRAYAPGEGQQLEVELNGEAVQHLDMAAGWQTYELALPTEFVRPGLNEVWLRFRRQYPASEVRLSPRTIGQSGVESPVNLVVQSAGQEVGDFGHIYVNGQDVSSNGRGYNVAVLHPQGGEVVQVASFDTNVDESASQALTDFLFSVPSGHIVAVAAADEASRLLSAEAVAALQGIGASGDLREKTRWGHAIIGVQGADPGAASEALGWIRPVTVVVGDGVTEPGLAAAFSALSFRAMDARQD